MPALFSHVGRLGDHEGQLIKLLGERYRGAGLVDVTVNLYTEARHEVFNETNRDQVIGDVVAWVRAHTPA